MIKEVQDSQGQIVLFIDEIHNIVGAGEPAEGERGSAQLGRGRVNREEVGVVLLGSEKCAAQV